MGYRCQECHVDICDTCTTRDAREGMKRWPMREVRKLMTHVESVQLESEVAAAAYHRGLDYLQEEDKASMSRVCGVLTDLRTSLEEAEEEIEMKRAEQDGYNYALSAQDF